MANKAWLASLGMSIERGFNRVTKGNTYFKEGCYKSTIVTLKPVWQQIEIEKTRGWEAKKKKVNRTMAVEMKRRKRHCNNTYKH